MSGIFGRSGIEIFLNLGIFGIVGALIFLVNSGRDIFGMRIPFLANLLGLWRGEVERLVTKTVGADGSLETDE